MNLVQFKYTADTYKDIQQNKFEDENVRARAINYLLDDYNYALIILQENLWKTKEEQTRAIHKVLRNSRVSYSALAVETVRLQLNENEIQTAIWITIESPRYARLLLGDFEGMTEKQRLQALETVLLDLTETRFCLSDPKIKECDRVYLTEKILDNTELLEAIIKNNKDTKRNLDDKARKMIFDKLLQVNSANYFYTIAIENFLLPHELEQVYKKYHKRYHDSLKLKFHQYYKFCEVFNPWLEDDYRRRMAQKIMTKTYWHSYSSAIKRIDFPQDVLDKFEAYKMAEKLRTIAI